MTPLAHRDRQWEYRGILAVLHKPTITVRVRVRVRVRVKVKVRG